MIKWYKKISVLIILVMCVGCLSVGCGRDVLDSVSAELTKYKLELEYNDAAKTLTGKQEVDYVNDTEGRLSDVAMHLYPVAFSERAMNKPVSALQKAKAYPNGISYGDIEIKQVSVNGTKQEAKYTGEDKNILLVTVLGGIEPTKKVKIRLEWVVTIPNCLHRFGYGDNTINLGNFYPIACVREEGEWIMDNYHSNGDPFYSSVANYDVSIIYDPAFTIASTGTVTSDIELASSKVTKTTARAVRDYAVVLSKKFSYITKMVNKVNVKYYYFDDERSKESLNAAVDSLKTFEKLFIKYPYSDISVVKADFVHGGMEYPQLVYISSDIDDYEEYRNVIIHEMAHQWWYGLVGNDEYNESWVDESLAEYSTALFYKYNPQYGIKYDEIISTAKSNISLFISVYNDVLGSVDTSMNKSLNEYDTDAEYVYMIYVKGVLMYDSLAKFITEEKVIKSLKSYATKFAFKNATGDNLISVFEQSSRVKLKDFFHNWIEGKVIL